MQIEHNPHWSHTSLGTPIELFQCKSAQSASIGAPLLFIGGVHGDEPEGVYLAQSLLGYLKTLKAPSHSWILIPCINPDGYLQNQRVNGHGVDLNRNYPSSNWSQHHTEPRYYPGPHPGSELEVQALVQLIQQAHPQVIFHFHSWKPCIVLTGEPGLIYAQALSESSGYGIQDTIGYPTPGSLSQFGWHDHKIPIICIEEEENLNEQDVWPKWEQGFKRIFNENF